MQNQGDKYNYAIHLNLKREWFDMIASGEKKEEYREIKKYWIRRLVGNWHQWQSIEKTYRHELLMPFGVDRIIFKNGYQKNARRMVVQWKSLKIDTPALAWCPNDTDLTKFQFVLELGDIIETNFQIA